MPSTDARPGLKSRVVVPLDTTYEFTSRKSGFGLRSEQEKSLSKPSASEVRSALVEKQQRDRERSARWAMLGAAREVLPFVEVKGQKRPHRISTCYRHRRGDSDVNGVELRRDADTGTAIFGNLAVCGSIWGCPVCSAAISRKRGEELRRGGRYVLENGGGLVLVTSTFKHNFGDELAVMLDRFQAAREDLHRQRAFRRLLDAYGVFGSVRGLEVTYGAAGWHPHTHDLLFLGRHLTSEERVAFSFAYWKLWRVQARKHGLTVIKEAFNVRATRDGATADDVDELTAYPNKADELNFDGGWDAAAEMTCAPAKVGRRGGRTIMQLLHDYTFRGDEQAGRLYAEAVQVFHNLNALRWSRGLKAIVGVDQDVTDQDVAEEIRPEYERFMIISPQVWSTVLRSGRIARGRLLELVGVGDLSEVQTFLLNCQSCYESKLAKIML